MVNLNKVRAYRILLDNITEQLDLLPVSIKKDKEAFKMIFQALLNAVENAKKCLTEQEITYLKNSFKKEDDIYEQENPGEYEKVIKKKIEISRLLED